MQDQLCSCPISQPGPIMSDLGSTATAADTRMYCHQARELLQQRWGLASAGLYPCVQVKR